jgi:hypothetical protein
MVDAVRKEWADALKACQESIAVIDTMAPLDSFLEELRGQIMQTFRAILDSYEQGI